MSSGRPLRALLFAQNDPWHKAEALADLLADWLQALPHVQVVRSADRGVLNEAGLRPYDLLLSLARLGPEASDTEEQALTSFVHRGGGLFGAHGSNIFPESRRGLLDLWGARFLRHPRYQPFTVRIVDHDHPITQGLADFEVRDELYVLDRPPPDAHILAVAHWEGVPHPMAYTKPFGAGHVYYCALGHDAGSQDHPSFRALLVRGVAWLADQTARALEKEASG